MPAKQMFESSIKNGDEKSSITQIRTDITFHSVEN